MSVIASFFIIKTSKLDDLLENATITITKKFFTKKITDNYWNYLANNAVELRGIKGSGYLYGNLLTFLDEVKGINLLQNEYDGIVQTLIDRRNASHFLFTLGQKNLFLHKLQSTNYSLKELQEFNEDFSEEGDAETARLSLEALQTLHDHLAILQNDSEVLLLIVA